MLITGAAYWEASLPPRWVVELDQALPGQHLLSAEFPNQYAGDTKQQAIEACIEDLKQRGLTGRLRIH